TGRRAPTTTRAPWRGRTGCARAPARTPDPECGGSTAGGDVGAVRRRADLQRQTAHPRDRDRPPPGASRRRPGDDPRSVADAGDQPTRVKLPRRERARVPKEDDGRRSPDRRGDEPRSDEPGAPDRDEPGHDPHGGSLTRVGRPRREAGRRPGDARLASPTSSTAPLGGMPLRKPRAGVTVRSDERNVSSRIGAPVAAPRVDWTDGRPPPRADRRADRHP